MKPKHWVIFQGVDDWRVGWMKEDCCRTEKIDIIEDASLDATAESISETLRNLGYKGEGVLLAVDSLQCLSASFLLESPGAKHNTQTFLYQLEEYLPLAAEDIATDFIVDGCHVLGVAIEAEREKPLLDELENRGIYVQSISPSALLAIQHLVREMPSDEPRSIIWQNGDRIEWYQISPNGQLLGWRLLTTDEQTLTQHIKLEVSQAKQLQLVLCGVSPALREAISKIPEIQTTESDIETDFTESAIITAEAVLTENAAPWIELRGGPLDSPDRYRAVRGTMRFAVAGVVALLIAMICGMVYRGYQYKNVANRYQQQQAAAFHEVFPGQAVPLGIRSRLESENTKLAGLRGASDELPDRTTALNVFYNALASLPEGMRYRITEMRVDRRRVYIDGEVLSHGDADKISVGMNNHGFKVQPPRTQKLSGKGVSVRIAAEADDKSTSKPGGGK